MGLSGVVEAVDSLSSASLALRSVHGKENRHLQAMHWILKGIPLLLLACAIFMQGQVHAETPQTAAESDTNMLPAVEEIQVFGKRAKSRNERDYQVKNGKRYVTELYGDLESILSIAAETKRLGNLKRVTTRGITMPQSYSGGVLNRYEHRFPAECNGEKFSLYEGDDFVALGYHYEEKIILDVMAGGGPFVAAQLWGPYDQIIGDRRNVSMKLMMGDGERDGMGPMKASYAIGMMPIMKRESYVRYGGAYVAAVKATVNCLSDSGEPVLRQAKSGW